jgi:hypothetical protein
VTVEWTKRVDPIKFKAKVDRDRIGNVLAQTGLLQLDLIPLAPRLMKRFDPRFGIASRFRALRRQRASDWHRWSKGERIVALCLVIFFISLPAFLLVSVQR